MFDHLGGVEIYKAAGHLVAITGDRNTTPTYGTSTQMTSHVLATLASLLVAMAATNTASGTPGGQRFDQAVGLNYAKQVLSDASTFIWARLNQADPAERKPVDAGPIIRIYIPWSGAPQIWRPWAAAPLALPHDRPCVDAVTLIVEDIGGVAFTRDDVVHVSAQRVGVYSGDVRTEVTGVLYHETTHVWQWDGQGQANRGLIEGIADFVRLKAGYASWRWVQPGQGDRWDHGYDVTARFLEYCDYLMPGFVSLLNAKMTDGYSDDFFAQILGKDVEQLWRDYKAKY
ncbi:hypothetical protein EJB05_56821, partial [Eragrostis curvula]